MAAPSPDRTRAKASSESGWRRSSALTRSRAPAASAATVVSSVGAAPSRTTGKSGSHRRQDSRTRANGAAGAPTPGAPLALEAPLRQIAQNAGVDGSVVAGKVRESNDKSFGFNAQTEEYGDMFKFGVIDPAKVVRTALEDAASVASLLITTECMIADRPADKSGAGAGGGMGGMGGMDGMM